MEKDCEQIIQEKDNLKILESKANAFINKCQEIKQKLLIENGKQKAKKQRKENAT